MKLQDIKFKAKSLLDGKWIEGDLMRINGLCLIRNSTSITEVDPTTVCQYTEVVDVYSDKELWEHDLLKDTKYGMIYEVLYDNINGCFSVKPTSGKWQHTLKLLSVFIRSYDYINLGSKFDKEV